MTNFVHLRVRTNYSLLQSTVRLSKLAQLSKQAKFGAVGVSDVMNMYGALEYSNAISEQEIMPIIGLTAHIKLESKFLDAIDILPFDYKPSVSLIAKNEEGYRTLLHLISNYYEQEGNNPEVGFSLKTLLEHNKGLILLTGGYKSFINPLWLNHQEEAKTVLKSIQEAYKDHCYIELQRHGFDIEKATEDYWLDYAYKYNLPVVATNDVRYLEPADNESYKALECVRLNQKITDMYQQFYTEEFYLKSKEAMGELFADLKEATDASVEIAHRISYRPKNHHPFLPQFCNTVQEENDLLYEKATQGLKLRLSKLTYAIDESLYFKRLDFEFDIIQRMQFSGYFLIVADFIGWSHANKVPVGPGRGSGAASLIAWALRITDVDPLRFGLFFERFLNPERISMPDFDIDFCPDRREKVVNYVKEKYGVERVANIITFGKLKSRAVVRDVGRVFGLNYNTVDQLTKLIPNNPASPISLSKAVETVDKLNAVQKDPLLDKLLTIAIQLEDLNRHFSTHAAGVVISNEPVRNYIPTSKDSEGNTLTQFSMKYVENAGLLKFDFLGLKTLSVIQKTLDFMALKGIQLDISNIPLDDPKTYDLLRKGDTTGIFQLESKGMQAYVKSLEIDKFEELIAMIALYRPGPMENLPSFIARKKGDEPVDYIHPLLTDILKETYGIIVYQEQVMQAAMILAGYSFGEADILRRAMGKKIASEMEQQREIFVKKSVEKGIDNKQANDIFDLLAKFASYGFNKNHSVVYALISYQTAYLKANYPLYFMAASMDYSYNDPDRLLYFMRECKSFNITVNPPSINDSEPSFAIKNEAIQMPLSVIHGLGEDIAGVITTKRGVNNYTSIMDFLHRLKDEKLNKRSVEFLIMAGVFDNYEPNRQRLLDALPEIMETINIKQDNTLDMFMEEMDTVSLLNHKYTTIMDKHHPVMELNHQLNLEKQALGFYLSSHPLDAYNELYDTNKVMYYQDLKEAIDQHNYPEKAYLLGMVMDKKTKRSQKGTTYAIVYFSDKKGNYDLMFFDNQMRQYEELLVVGRAVVLTVSMVNQEGVVRIRSGICEDLATKNFTQSAAKKPSGTFPSKPKTIPTQTSNEAKVVSLAPTMALKLKLMSFESMAIQEIIELLFRDNTYTGAAIAVEIHCPNGKILQLSELVLDLNQVRGKVNQQAKYLVCLN